MTGARQRVFMSDKKTGSEGGAVPQAVVSRLSLYLRELQHLLRAGKETTSSTQLGQCLGFTDAQVRKDLAYFGQFGYPGLGYRCEELVAEIKRILGTDRNWPVVIVGIGNLGRALLGYRGFGEQGFRVEAAFDSDPTKVGQTIDGVPVYAIEDLENIAAQRQIKLGVIAVPAVAAQEVADRMVAAGLEGILNFAPVTLNLDEKTVGTVAVDLAIELEQLTFAVVNRRKNA
jgi:redox-sensing transcriptional repressor